VYRWKLLRRVTGNGGGIYNYASPSHPNLIITDNIRGVDNSIPRIGDSGEMVADFTNSSSILKKNIFCNNQAIGGNAIGGKGNGGGILNADDSSPSLINVSIKTVIGGNGGAIGGKCCNGGGVYNANNLSKLN
jgi:hypothetical protein